MTDVLALEPGAGKTTAIFESIEKFDWEHGLLICGHDPRLTFDRLYDRWSSTLVAPHFHVNRAQGEFRLASGPRLKVVGQNTTHARGHRKTKVWIDDADAIEEELWLAAAIPMDLVLVTCTPCEPWLKTEARLDAEDERRREQEARQAEDDRLYGEEELMMAKIAGAAGDMTAIDPTEFGRALRLSGLPRRRGL